MIAFSTEVRAGVILDALDGNALAGRRALDIGAGTGVVGKMLRDRLGLDLVAADVKNQLTVDLPFVRFEAGRSLPFADRSFDIAFLNDVLHHLEFSEQPRLILEALRAAKEVFIFEVEPGPLARFIDRFFNCLHYRAMPLPLSFRSADGWASVLNGIGARCEMKKVPRPFPFYPLSHVAIRCSSE